MPTVAAKDPAKPNRAVIIDGKKFLWDGQLFEIRDAAERLAEAYTEDNFEVQMVEEDGSYLVYTRRMVKEIVVTAS